MSQVLEQTTDFLAAIAARRPSSGDRLAAFEKFLAAGVPGHKDEEWKYTSLRLLSESRFENADSRPEVALLSSLPGIEEVNRLVFWNGGFVPSLSTSNLPSGVTFRSLKDAAPDRFGQIAKLEGKLGSTNDERFVHLNAALYSDGVSLEIAAGKVIEEPIQIVFLAGPGALSFPRVFVKAEPNAQAKIVEYHAGSGSYATFPVAEFDLAQDSIVEHTRIQIDSPEAFHIGTLAVDQAATSTYTSNNVQFGAKIGRLDANVWVGGEHAETWLNGAYVGSGDQQLDNHTRIDHAVPNCHSFEVYKGILSDRSIGVFNGKIFVYQDAQKTDAKQTNQAL
ncbi:MAG TPA: SufD family Fe-S cluster assembly protein, partial [Fimbriimonadaceae bacterium]|nr:SufD family Fe-S cluster assembly protein [Fimbriimonadaceae bacterium]